MQPREPINLDIVNYTGPSMNPTLRTGDRLNIIPYDGQKIRRGDVIVFISPQDGSKVVHRVTSVNSDGVRTRGDNCNHEDGWILNREHIFGRVVSVQRGNRRGRVFGGSIGQFFGLAFRAIHTIDVGVSSRLRPVYNRLAMTGIFRRWLPPGMKIRVISFDREEGTEIQILMGRRMIGRWLPGMKRWYIRRPFRLFVDEDTLPENKAKVSGVRCQVVTKKPKRIMFI